MTTKIMATKVDVIDLIDRHRVTGFQIIVLILCMLVAALDGFDTQAIGYTAPAIAAQIHLPMPQFGQVGSAGLLGAAIGALSFGPLADLFGRKWFMIIAMVVFAVFSYLTAQSGSLNELLAYRFFAGLGLGGVTPAFLAMGAELAPKRLRSVFVTVLFASFPGGGLIGSLIASWVIPAFGWQSLFYIGAVAPLVIAVILAVYLPESIRFLLARNIGHDRGAPHARSHHAGRSAGRCRARRAARSGARGRSGDASVHRGPRGADRPALGAVLHGVHGSGHRHVLDAGGAELGRLLAVVGGSDHRPEQSRQRHRQRLVRLARASRRRLPRARSGLHSRRSLLGLVRPGDVVGAVARERPRSSPASLSAAPVPD